MKRFLAVVFACAATTLLADFDAGVAKARCESEWPGDFQMIKFCLDQQTSAAAKLDATVPSLDDVMLARYRACVVEWGEDFQMRAFCLDQQVQARRQLPGILESVPSDIGQAISSKCSIEWGKDFVMLAFCFEQQASAWRSLNN